MTRMGGGVRGLRRERGAVGIAEGARPVCGPDDVRLEVVCVGVCRTDVYVAEGRIPVPEGRVLGHEVCGVVRETGASTRGWAPGDAAIVMPSIACGRCDGSDCLAPQMLGIDRDGAFADQVVVPARALHRPRGLPMRLAAYAEPMAASMAVLDLDLPREGRGVVLGAGRIATLTLRVLRDAGFTSVTMHGPRDGRLERGGFDFVIETAATAETLAVALAALRCGGTLVLKSRPHAPVPLDVAAAVQRRARIVAARYAEMDAAIALMRRAPELVADLLGPVLSLEAFDVAFASREDTKTFLTPLDDPQAVWARARGGA